MAKKSQIKSLSLAVSAAIAGSLFTVSAASAGENPFQLTDLQSGYQVADHHGDAKSGGEMEGKCGGKMEGKCGGKMEGKCGGKMEGKCGMGMMMKKMDDDGDGAISRDEFMQHHDKKFTKMDVNEDGKVTEDEMKMMMKKMHEGKCGKEKSEG